MLLLLVSIAWQSWLLECQPRWGKDLLVRTGTFICRWEGVSVPLLLQVWTDLHHTGFLPFVANPLSSMNHMIRYSCSPPPFFLPNLFITYNNFFASVQSLHLASLTHVRTLLFMWWTLLLISQCRGNECWGLWKPIDEHGTAPRRVQCYHLLPEPGDNSCPGECFWNALMWHRFWAVMIGKWNTALSEINLCAAGLSQ